MKTTVLNPSTTGLMPRLAEFSNEHLYDYYRVRIQMRKCICGGIPRNPAVLAAWVKAKTGFNDELTTKQIAKITPAMEIQLGRTAAVAKADRVDVDPTPEDESREPLSEVAEKIDASWNGFAKDEKLGLYIETRQVKALLREACTMLRINTKKVGAKQVFQHGFEVKGLLDEDRIYLGVQEPTGHLEGPIHVVGPQGPRSALKRVDYVDRAVLEFEIWLFKTEPGEKRHLSEKDIRDLLVFAQEDGLGADRSQLRGKFNIVGFEARKGRGTDMTKASSLAKAG